MVRITKKELNKLAVRYDAEKVAENVYTYENYISSMRSQKTNNGGYVYKEVSYLYYTAGIYGNSGQMHQLIDYKGEATYVYYS